MLIFNQLKNQLTQVKWWEEWYLILHLRVAVGMAVGLSEGTEGNTGCPRPHWALGTAADNSRPVPWSAGFSRTHRKACC